MLPVVLALASALAWGVSDFLGGLTSRRLALSVVMLVTQLVGLALMLPLAVLHAQPLLDVRTVGFAVAGSASGRIGIAALDRGMGVGLVSSVAPISATGAALPVLFGILRGERTTPLQSLGMGLAVVGIVLASRAAAEPNTASRPMLARGVVLALVAALGFGGFFVLLHEASVRDVLWATVVQRLTGLAVMVIATLVLRPSLSIGWSGVPSLVLVGALDTGANVLYAYASTLGMVSLAAVLASLFPVVTVLLARVVLRERLSASQATGVVCALTGVALISVQ
ncbi:MAG: EamA family transporter [Chloroflexota bacterium]